MRLGFFFFPVFFVISFSAFTQTTIKSVLIIGDSYLKGQFGEYLQKDIHATGKYDVLSIAIGGAGSRTFLPPMKNQCCGYRVRQSCAGVALVKSKKSKETKIPVLESSEKATSKIVMRYYHGDLLSVMNMWKPDAIILVLGSNWLNAHEDLFKIIKSYNADIPLIWIGPFDTSESAGRYSIIENVIKSKTNSLLIKSDSIVNKLKIVPTHFAGPPAKKLADEIFLQVEPFLKVYL